MINTFKLKPSLEGKRTNRQSHDSRSRPSEDKDDFDYADTFETEQERESRQYTNFSMYNSAEEGLEVKKGIKYERSESLAESKRKIFQRNVKKVVKFQALVDKLKSFNSKLVKATLIEMVPLINNPDVVLVLMNAGLCGLLLDLLKFDPLTHSSIVGLSLQALLSVVSIPECALTVIKLPSFYQTMETFLKADKALTQKIAARIVHRCFVQPIQNEWIVLQDKNMLSLLFQAMELPYKDVQMNIFNLLEDLTYHCDNTLQLCVYGESVEVDFIRMVVDVVLAEGNNDIRLCAMKVYLNALSAIHLDRLIARAVILHALAVETALLKHMKSLQRSKMRKTSALLTMSRNSKIFLMGDSDGSTRDTAPDGERGQMSRRRSSITKLKTSKFVDVVEEGSKAKTESSNEGSGALLQVTEEIGVITEILWLIRSSEMFQKVVKHAKRTNLVEPIHRVDQLLTAL